MDDFFEEPKRIGCLIFPLSAIGGLIVGALLFAAIGFSASISTTAGCIGGLVAVLVAGKIFNRGKGGYR